MVNGLITMIHILAKYIQQRGYAILNHTFYFIEEKNKNENI